MNPAIRKGAYLPHLQPDHACFAIVFRLADSFPQTLIQSMREQRIDLLKSSSSFDSAIRRRRRWELTEVDAILDKGHGNCLFREKECAGLVVGALNYFNGKRYQLHAWCIMPNHIHVLFTTISGIRVPEILHSWKSFTANKINRLTRSSGPIWHTEYYDHLVRDEGDFAHAYHYILSNPIKAGLENWPWVWGEHESK